MTTTKTYKSIMLNVIMLICGLISAFFIFYTVRLLYITQGLTVIRAGGEGTYVGAIVFPILAIAFGYLSWRSFKSAQKDKANNKE